MFRPAHAAPRPLHRSAWAVAYAIASVSAMALSCTAMLESTAHAAPHRATSVDALARRLQAWVADADPALNARAVERVRQGVPPGAMVAFLVAVREHPGPLYTDVVRQATQYRRLAVRGHALAAWAAFSPTDAAAAIARAADDPELGVRRLALTLAKQHPSPAAEEVVVRLLAKDAVLTAEASQSTDLVPEGPEAAAPEAPPSERPESEGEPDDESYGAESYGSDSEGPAADDVVIIEDGGPAS